MIHLIFVVFMVWIMQICLFYPHLSTLLLDLTTTRPLSPFTFLCAIVRSVTNYIWFCFDLCNSVWCKGLLLFCFLCVCPLPMMWIRCWVYLCFYILVMRISFLQLRFVLPSIFVMPMECIIFFLYGAIFRNMWLSEIQSFLTKYTLKIRFYFEIKSKGIRNKL